MKDGHRTHTVGNQIGVAQGEDKVESKMIGGGTVKEKRNGRESNARHKQEQETENRDDRGSGYDHHL